jgi:hypothetical protein
MLALPEFAQAERCLPRGDYPFRQLLPLVAKSPALRRIAPSRAVRGALLRSAQVKICGLKGYAFVEVEAPRIVISERYYAEAEGVDLYLDLLHELTHLRQIGEGYDLWDDRFPYVDRPTEVEAYAVAVEEARRLRFTESAVIEHLKNPWMTRADVRRLLDHIDSFLAGGPLPHGSEALQGAPFVVRHPWRCPRSAERAKSGPGRSRKEATSRRKA